VKRREQMWDLQRYFVTVSPSDDVLIAGPFVMRGDPEHRVEGNLAIAVVVVQNEFAEIRGEWLASAVSISAKQIECDSQPWHLSRLLWSVLIAGEIGV